MRRFLIILTVSLALAGHAVADDPVYQTRDLTGNERAIVAHAVKDKLRDPDSAQFKWTKIIRKLRPDGAADYCVLVNAKNSYGGYAGFDWSYLQVVPNKNGQIVSGVAVLIGNGEETSPAHFACAKTGYAAPVQGSLF